MPSWKKRWSWRRPACRISAPTIITKARRTPVFFGSALKNFGVKELIGALAEHAPPPRGVAARGRTVEPAESEVSGFVFKVQANMDPNHRDRVAFLRLASGQFKRGMKLKQSGTGKAIGVHNPILFFAQERETVDEAFPGDIIGIPNHGTLRVGDTLSESGSIVFTGIPNFAPEIFAPRAPRRSDEAEAPVARAAEPGRGRRDAGVQAADRRQLGGGRRRPAPARRAQEPPQRGIRPRSRARAIAPYDVARWLSGEPAEIEKFLSVYRAQVAEDRDGAPVFLAKSNWELGYAADKFPKLKFAKTRERSDVHAEG